MSRIVIAGGPRTGKTTLSKLVGASTVRHTDDLGWSEASAEVSTWFDVDGSWIVEGVAVPRALRKWLAANPDGKPCDVAYWLEEPHERLTPGQASMAKGCAKVWGEILPELEARGVDVRNGADQ